MLKKIIFAASLLNFSCSSGPSTPEEICQLQPSEEGEDKCDAAIRIYWHNSETGLCELAYYGGCGATENNFQTLDECESLCGENPPGALKCGYSKLVYSSGDTFPDRDGCNTCTCQEDGQVGCTEIACD